MVPTVSDAVKKDPHIRDIILAGSEEFEDFLAGIYHPELEAINLNKKNPKAPIDLSLKWRNKPSRRPIFAEVEFTKDDLWRDDCAQLKDYIRFGHLSCPSEKKARLIEYDELGYSTIYLRGNFEKVVLMKGKHIILNGKERIKMKDYGNGRKTPKSLIYSKVDYSNCISGYAEFWIELVIEILNRRGQECNLDYFKES
jgi:hypothetical protein